MKKIIFILLASVIALTARAQEDWHLTANAGVSYFRHDNITAGRDRNWRPVIELGIVREISPNWRLQTSVEWMLDRDDEIVSGNFVNWHIGEIDYRLFDDLALTIYGGMARYYREQPSWGYSRGMGFKYRLGNNWLLSLDIARAAVDISDSVPQSNTLHNREFLRWTNLTLDYQF